METWFKRNYKTIIISAFLIPIMTVALVSISHVTKWYGLSNPFTWAIYLSIGIEIAALSALAAISADMGRKVYFPFGIVTLVQFIGNIYFAYSFIDVTSESFKSWVELVAPFVEFMGVDATDLVGHKRFLAFFAGGMLPIISLSFLHMLVKFTQENKEKGIDAIIDDGGISEYIQAQKNKSKEEVKEEIPVVDAKDIVGEVSRVRLTEEDLAILEKYLNNPPKPNDTLVKAAEEYKKQQEPQITEQPIEVYEKELDGFDGFDVAPIITPEVTQEVKIEETPTVTPTESITPTLTVTETPTMTPTDTEVPTFTPTATVTPVEVIEVSLENIPVVIPIVETPVHTETPIETPVVETPTIEVEEIPLPTMEDAPIEVEEEYIPTPDEEEINFQKDWDVTLMDGLEDEPPYEEPSSEPVIETPTEELPTIESEEEKKN
jgi:hypothetical protein